MRNIPSPTAGIASIVAAWATTRALARFSCGRVAMSMPTIMMIRARIFGHFWSIRPPSPRPSAISPPPTRALTGIDEKAAAQKPRQKIALAIVPKVASSWIAISAASWMTIPRGRRAAAEVSMIRIETVDSRAMPMIESIIPLRTSGNFQPFDCTRYDWKRQACRTKVVPTIAAMTVIRPSPSGRLGISPRAASPRSGRATTRFVKKARIMTSTRTVITRSITRYRFVAKRTIRIADPVKTSGQICSSTIVRPVIAERFREAQLSVIVAVAVVTPRLLPNWNEPDMRNAARPIRTANHRPYRSATAPRNVPS